MNPFRRKREARQQAKYRIVSAHSGGMKRYFKTVEGTSRRLYSDMTTVPITGNELVRRSQRTLRAQSRAEVCYDGYGKRFLGLVGANVVGPRGFDFQARTKFRRPGQPAQSDEPANQALETAWRDWGKPQNCDVHLTTGWAGLQQMAVRTAAQDGEIFVRLYSGRAYGRYGFQVQLIDPELVDILYNEDLRNGNVVRMGIEFTTNWVPVAYYFRAPNANRHNPYYYYSSANGQTYTRVPRGEILHVFIPPQVGTWRGLPWMASSLGRMHMTDGGEEAALMNMRVGASTMGVYKNVGDMSPLADNPEDGDEPEDVPLKDEVEPGQFMTLPPGYELDKFDPTYPDGDFDPFMKRILKGVAAGLGISYHNLSMDLGDVNYSTARVARLDEQDMWMMLQDWFREQFCEPIYNAWLDQQFLMNTITINDVPINPAREAKYREVEFHGRKWGSPDPEKEWKSKRERLELRQASPSRIMIESGINDPRAEWDRYADDLDYMASKGLTMQQAMAPAATALPPGEDDEST